MTIALGYIVLSLCVARGGANVAAAASLSSTTTTGDVDTVNVASTGAEAPETMYRRELFYRVDDELLKLWNADDDGTFSFRCPSLSRCLDRLRFMAFDSLLIWP